MWKGWRGRNRIQARAASFGRRSKLSPRRGIVKSGRVNPWWSMGEGRHRKAVRRMPSIDADDGEWPGDECAPATCAVEARPNYRALADAAGRARCSDAASQGRSAFPLTGALSGRR